MNRIVEPWTEASLGNQPVVGIMGEGDRAAMVDAAARKIEELFDILKVDHRNDHNTRDTPARVARMMVEETLRGRFTSPPAHHRVRQRRALRPSSS